MKLACIIFLKAAKARNRSYIPMSEARGFSLFFGKIGIVDMLAENYKDL
jgi:hypothetical protein